MDELARLKRDLTTVADRLGDVEQLARDVRLALDAAVARLDAEVRAALAEGDPELTDAALTAALEDL